MKNSLILVVIFLIISIEIKSQDNETSGKTKYALELSQYFTQSGFNTGTALSVAVIPDRMKNLSIGLSFCPESKKFTSVTFHHERTLINNLFNESSDISLFYNMIYRVTKIDETSSEGIPESHIGTYKSLEHHLGIELNVKLARQVSVHGALGYGCYLGSIKKPVESDRFPGKIEGTNGLGAIAKLGVRYIL
ncbi:MAG: hypothetical protein JW801_19285 [Bacteroidales bacterium]|nr:hypothetical protein [Bacteroidales bacterium]